MAYPILAARDSWYTQGNSGILRSTITEIHIRDSYTPTGPVTAQWDGSAAKDGSITVYVEGTVLTISGNGSGRIALSPDATATFSDSATPPANSFVKCESVTGLEILDTSACTSLRRFIGYMPALRSVDVSAIDTGNCTDISNFFGTVSSYTGPSQLTTITGLENWKTGKVTSIQTILQGCPNISAKSFKPIEDWDVSNLETALNAFYGIQVPHIDLSRWNTAKLKDAGHMLSDNAALIDVKLPRLSACENFGAMFNDDTNLEVIDVRDVDFSNATALSQLWERCTKLKKIIGHESMNVSKAGTVKVKGQGAFAEMFAETAIEELDLSKWDMSHAYDAILDSSDNMFLRMKHLRKISVPSSYHYDYLDEYPQYAPLLPVPDPTYIPGADGHWYDKTGKAYTPEEAIKTVPNTYYASKAVLYGSEPAIMDRAQMHEIAEYVRNATGKTELMQIPGVMKAVVDFIGKKLDATALPAAINTALAQAKASGAFDGKDGAAGRSIAWGTLSDPTAVSDTHATIASIIKNHTRIAAPVKNAASFKAHDLALLPGQYNDAPRQHYWLLFDVDKVVGSQIQGYPLGVIEEGLPGAKGETPKKGTDYWTEADREAIVKDTLAALPKARGVDF